MNGSLITIVGSISIVCRSMTTTEVGWWRPIYWTLTRIVVWLTSWCSWVVLRVASSFCHGILHSCKRGEDYQLIEHPSLFPGPFMGIQRLWKQNDYALKPATFQDCPSVIHLIPWSNLLLLKRRPTGKSYKLMIFEF